MLPEVAPLIVTLHVPPAESVQVEPEGKVMLPVPPICDIVIVSPVTVPEKLVTVAVHKLVEAIANDVGTQETAVLVVSLFTVRANVPELTALLASPLNVPVIV